MSNKFKGLFENVIQQHFTLSMLYRYIDEIHISKTKIVGIYFKNEPLNIVNQATQSSILINERMKNMKEMKRKSVGCYVRVSTISQDIDEI